MQLPCSSAQCARPAVAKPRFTSTPLQARIMGERNDGLGAARMARVAAAAAVANPHPLPSTVFKSTRLTTKNLLRLDSSRNSRNVHHLRHRAQRRTNHETDGKGARIGRCTSQGTEHLNRQCQVLQHQRKILHARGRKRAAAAKHQAAGVGVVATMEVVIVRGAMGVDVAEDEDEDEARATVVGEAAHEAGRRQQAATRDRIKGAVVVAVAAGAKALVTEDEAEHGVDLRRQVATRGRAAVAAVAAEVRAKIVDGDGARVQVTSRLLQATASNEARKQQAKRLRGPESGERKRLTKQKRTLTKWSTSIASKCSSKRRLGHGGLLTRPVHKPETLKVVGRVSFFFTLT
eukprot:m.294196 g.294196  ORF g.294196 m.294196 type:complete len:347 (-) comp19501_c10_seq6:103-1143(-)